MHTRDIRSGSRGIVAAAIAAAFALVGSGLSAQAGTLDLQQRHQFQIPSESLGTALSDFAAQTHIHLLASGVPAGTLSLGANGELSSVKALSALLRGTGLSFRQIDAETIAIVPAAVARLRATQFQLVGDALDQDALADAAAAAPAPAASSLQEVQVTGTRIIRQGYESPTPMASVNIGDIQDVDAATIGNALNNLPVFQGTTTVANTSLSDNEGAQVLLDLRNLTASRTLVLLDGVRLPTANQEDAPDVSLIPDALVQRVDVVTGGASAVYGTDAIAGVVNYVLDTNFTGIKGDVEGGMSGYGDGASDKISFTAGTTFVDGRLHLLVSADQGYQAAVPGFDRSWDTVGRSAYQNPAYLTNKGAPEYLWSNCCVSTPGLSPGGVILNGPLAGVDFGPGGAVGQYQNGFGETGPGLYQVGGDYQQSAFQGSSSILASVADQHYFARLAFDVTPNIQAFAEFINGSDHTIDQCCYDYYQTGIGTLYSSNPYLPSSVATAAAADYPNGGFTLGDTLRFPPSQMEVNGGLGVDDYRYTDIYQMGLRGKLNIGKNSYNWELYGQQGINIEQFGIVNESIKTNLSDAIEAVTVGNYGGYTGYTNPQSIGGATVALPYNATNFPNPLGLAAGSITCASNLLPLANAAHTSNCAPYNVFGVGVASPAAINYTQGQASLREVGQQNILGGSITGEPFSDWAGPVSVALDAEYRHESIGGTSDAISQQTGYFSTNFFPYFGSQNVTEGALETVIPLLRDKPGIQELDLNAGARAIDYSTSGYVTAYKFGLEYTPINDLRFRATDSFDIRAPNLYNLFGYSNGHGTNVDPFDNNANVPSYSITTGNTNLRAEKSHQYEIGLVFQPVEVPGLNISIDYYHIKIAEAISTLTALYEAQQCYATRIGTSDTGSSPYCADIARNADGTLYSITTPYLNLASFMASGTDYNLDYRKNLMDMVSTWKGALDFHLAATNTIHNVTNTGIPGPSEVLDAAGTSNVPRWALFGTLTYQLDAWRFAWSERYDSSVRAAASTAGGNTLIYCTTNCPNPIPAGYATVGYNPRVPTYFIANLMVDYTFLQHDQKTAEAYLNVDNVLNRIPPNAYVIPGQLFAPATNTTLYDTMGLYARLGVRFRL